MVKGTTMLAYSNWTVSDFPKPIAGKLPVRLLMETLSVVSCERPKTKHVYTLYTYCSYKTNFLQNLSFPEISTDKKLN